MQLSAAMIKDIITKAETLTDHLNANVVADNTVGSQKSAESILDNWCSVAFEGNQNTLRKRLEWDGLSPVSIGETLCAAERASTERPRWCGTISNIVELYTPTNYSLVFGANSLPFIKESEPIAFEEILVPFVLYARNELQILSGNNYCSLSPQAHSELERSLLARIANCCIKPLSQEFTLFRAQNYPLSLFRMSIDNDKPTNKDQYGRFVRLFYDENVASFLVKYAALSRILGIIVDFWVDNTIEFLGRLASDWHDIEKDFSPQSPLKQVIHILPDLSDIHNEGHTVQGIVFDSGLRIVYKPKDMGMEFEYYRMLSWINSCAIPRQMKTCLVLPKDGYGWVEFIERRPCSTLADVSAYYYRSGMLLGIIYILGGTDCHFQNIVANGEYPMLVDMETLFHPVMAQASPKDDNPAYEIFTSFQKSIFRTGFVPNWNFNVDGEIYDVSGLGSMDGQTSKTHMIRLRRLNTDNMVTTVEEVDIPKVGAGPRLSGESPIPHKYVDEITAGFEDIYRLFMQNRDFLLNANSPLMGFSHQKIRFVFRPTSIYGDILRASLDAILLQSGIERSIFFEVLSKSLLQLDDKPPYWPLFSIEIGALEQLDIPFFNCFTDGTSIIAKAGEEVPNCFVQSSFESVIANIKNLNSDDLQDQKRFIFISFYARVLPRSDLEITHTETKHSVCTATHSLNSTIIPYVLDIASDIRKRAFLTGDGTSSWVDFGFASDLARYQFRPIGTGLYDGYIGVALFLAALEKVLPALGFGDLARSSLNSLRESLQKNHKLKGLEQIGGAVGIASVIYALVRISEFLDDTSLIEDALRLTSFLTPDNIAADEQYDVIAGTAGAILGLRVLLKKSDDKRVLAAMTTCGEHLLAHRTTSKTGYKAWITIDDKLLTGFSHGAAGIAYALLALYEIRSDNRFLKAAQEAIAYERSVFLPEDNNWPDFRQDPVSGKFPCVLSWCHGAPGIGLARLGGLHILDSDLVREDIDIALQSTLKSGVQSIDHLCCGNLGRLETLLKAGDLLNRSELIESARQWTRIILGEANRNGFYRLFPNLPIGVYSPGFFQGMSGIGYELLRLVYPNLLPSVLLWE